MPQPDIVWYKDALPIDPVKMLRYRVLVGGSLQVNGLLPDDTGMFQCFARNVAGEVQTNTYLAVTSESRPFLLEKSVVRQTRPIEHDSRRTRHGWRFGGGQFTRPSGCFPAPAAFWNRL